MILLPALSCSPKAIMILLQLASLETTAMILLSACVYTSDNYDSTAERIYTKYLNERQLRHISRRATAMITFRHVSPRVRTMIPLHYVSSHVTVMILLQCLLSRRHLWSCSSVYRHERQQWTCSGTYLHKRQLQSCFACISPLVVLPPLATFNIKQSSDSKSFYVY